MIKWVEVYELLLDGCGVEALDSALDEVARFRGGTVEVDGASYRITDEMYAQGRFMIENRPVPYGNGQTVVHVGFFLPVRM